LRRESDKHDHSKIPLVVGTLKSGISSFYGTLKSTDSGFNYDQLSNEGTGLVSWKLGRGLTDELSDRIGPVVHLVRHPLTVVSVLMQECFCFSDKATRETNAKEEARTLSYLQKADPQFPVDKNVMTQALYHWVHWNKMIMKNYPDAKIMFAEDLDPPTFFAYIKRPIIEISPWGHPRSFVPESQKANITWDDVERNVDDPRLIEEAQALLKQMNYFINPPLKVNAIHYSCEDQTHFLVNFLSILPYSPERPFRFRFNRKLDHYGIIKSKDIPPYSVLYLIAFQKKWQDYVEIGERNPGLVVQVLKDEYCTYNPFDIPNTSLMYHGFYHFELFKNNKVLWTPLGVRKIFPRVLPHEILPPTNRAYAFSLIVSLSTSSSRAELAKIARRIAVPSFIHTIEEWSGNFTGYLGPEEYKKKLLNSVFTLSPRGHNPECYRMYEACETGSIPIIEEWSAPANEQHCDGAFEPFYRSNAPFIYIKDWSKLGSLLKTWLEDPVALLQKQKDVMEWYFKFKLEIIQGYENNLAGVWLKDTISP